jgi:hypothetical protein
MRFLQPADGVKQGLAETHGTPTQSPTPPSLEDTGRASLNLRLAGRPAGRSLGSCVTDRAPVSADGYLSLAPSGNAVTALTREDERAFKNAVSRTEPLASSSQQSTGTGDFGCGSRFGLFKRISLSRTGGVAGGARGWDGV